MARLTGVFLNLTPTGMVPTKAMTPHVPLTVDEIVTDVTRCVTLGANIVHLHARDESGLPTYRKEVYAKLVGGIRDAFPDLAIGVSLSGRNHPELDQRADPLKLRGDVKPDLGSLTLGSMNFSRSASVNSPETILRLADAMAEAEIKPELEVFDLGMMNYAHYLVRKGVLCPPHYFNILLGNIGTAQATPAHLGQLLAELPDDSYVTVAGIGDAQRAMNAAGLLFADGARVGLEDSIWYDRERALLATNESVVQRVLDMAALFGRSVATRAEVREALGLVGGPRAGQPL